jgi:phosphatidylglycerophosphate synthase
MTYKEVYDIAVPRKKREMEKWNLFAAHIGRPISVLMTIPLVNTKVKPITVTFWSVVAALLGAVFMSFGSTVYWCVVGWFFFFLWNLLDGVDGNLARCQNACSKRGELWDAFGGYAALVLTYISASIASFNDIIDLYVPDKHWILIIGGLTSALAIFPRLIFQKKLNLGIDEDKTNSLRDKKNYGIKQIIALNVISATGLMQPIILVCIFLHSLSIFVVAYFLFNSFITLVSLYKLLK